MKKEKKKGSCLKTILIVFGVFIIIGVIGNLAGGNDKDTSVTNTSEPPVSEIAENSQEADTDTSDLSLDKDIVSDESSGNDDNNSVENETEIPFTEKYDNEIVASSKMILDRFISGYKIALAPQLWTIADFDENGAVIAITNITDKATDLSQTVIIVLTPIMESDQMTGSTPHYVSVGDTVYGDDGYCDEFFSNLEEILNSF